MPSGSVLLSQSSADNFLHDCEGLAADCVLQLSSSDSTQNFHPDAFTDQQFLIGEQITREVSCCMKYLDLVALVLVQLSLD